jgi:hypothetical protein
MIIIYSLPKVVSYSPLTLALSPQRGEGIIRKELLAIAINDESIEGIPSLTPLSRWGRG